MNKKRYLIIGIVAFSVLLISGVTYAWYTWSTSSENETKIVTNLGAATVYYDAGSDISADIMPVSSKEEGIIKEITVKTDKNTTYKLSFNLYLDILDLPDIFKHESFKYAIYKDSVLVKEGNFTETFETCTVNDTSHIVLISNESITTTTSTYTLYLWIDGENYTNPSEMQNQTIRLKLHADGQNAVLGENSEPLVQKITDLYASADKTTVENNGVIYNYATSVSLMNDRLGGTTEDYDAGNIRYYGANPNNYIDIGDVYEEDTTFNNWELIGWHYYSTEACYEDNDCDTYYAYWGYDTADACYEDWLHLYGISSVEEACGTTTIPKGTPILYRIIGLFKDVELADGSKQDLIKVIRNEKIGYYSWDISDSTVNGGYGINEWSQADLMKLLNPGYESETVGGSFWWNSGIGTCYNNYNEITSCDFTGKGLSSNVQNEIVNAVWNTGGWNSSSVYSNQIYNYERGTNVAVPGITCSGTYCNDTVTRTTSWTGKVALMYPSDYGYATDFNSCSSNLYYYNDAGCYNNDWLLYETATLQWLLTPFSSGVYSVWNVDNDAFVSEGTIANDGRGSAVRPVFYLNSEIVVSGNGSEANPYVVR